MSSRSTAVWIPGKQGGLKTGKENREIAGEKYRGKRNRSWGRGDLQVGSPSTGCWETEEPPPASLPRTLLPSRGTAQACLHPEAPSYKCIDALVHVALLCSFTPCPDWGRDRGKHLGLLSFLTQPRYLVSYPGACNSIAFAEN